MSILRLAFCILALILSIHRSEAQKVPAPSGISIYVSTAGNDRNSGTEQKPFATLDRARIAVRAIRSHGLPPGGVTVWVHGGLYLLDNGFTLGKDDSGEPGKPITYRAIANEHPRLFGGVQLDPTTFESVTNPSVLAQMRPEARAHVLQLHLKQPIERPQRYPDIFKGNGGMVQLIRDDSIMPLSRWPNRVYTTMESVVDSGITPPRGGTFHYRPEVASHAEQWVAAAKSGRLWLTGFWRVPFETESIRVRSVDVASKTITLAVPAPGGIGSKYVETVDGTRHGNGKEQYYAFNLLEEIGRPGEWSYDFNSETLYFWPPAANDSKTHELLLATFTKPIIELDGASYIAFEGLAIEGGVVQAVRIKNGFRDTIAGCLIRNTGDGGVDIEGGGSDTIQSNDFEHIGSYGIRMVAGDRRTLTPANLVADNNHIRNFGEQERITDAIYLDGVGNHATHNLIHDGPYNGIRYQGNDEYMAYNEIHHIGLDAGDLGGFYTNGDWAAQGNVVAYNFVHHAPNANGSYLDDGSSGRTTVGNIFYKLASGLFLGGGHNNVLDGNLIIDCKVGIHVDNRGVARQYDSNAHHLTSFLKTIDPNSPPWSTRYPDFLPSILADPTEPTGNAFRNNVILNSTQPYQLSSPAILTPAQNPVFTGDPQFVDEANLNLKFRASSPIYPLLPQWKPIPFSEIGLKIDQYRKALPSAEETGRNADRTETQLFDSNIDMKASDQLGAGKR